MIKQKTVLETKIGDKDYIFICDPASPITEVYQALDFFRSYALGRIQEAAEQMKDKEVKE